MSERDASGTGPADQKATIGQLVGQLSEQSSRLIRSEIALLKAEVTTKAKHSGVGIGLVVSGAVTALYGIGFLFYTIMEAFDVILWRWQAALVTTLLMFAGAGVLALVGAKLLKRGMPPVTQDSVDRIKQDVASIKEGLHR